MSTLNAASAAVRRPLPKRKNGKKLKVSTVLIHTGLLLLVAFNLFPLYWMVTFSLKTNEEILGIGQAANLVGLPKHYEWNNYTRALNTGNGDMGRYFLNSLIVAVAAITITIIAAFMATLPRRVIAVPWRAMRVGMTQSNMSTPRATHSAIWCITPRPMT